MFTPPHYLLTRLKPPEQKTKAVTDIKQAIITIVEKLVLRSLSLLHCSPNPLTPSEMMVVEANLPDVNICLSFAAGKKTRGRLTAPEAQTQHVHKGDAFSKETWSNSSVSKRIGSS